MRSDTSDVGGLSMPSDGGVAPAFIRASQFLALEAYLLDQGRFREWFDMLDDELTYLIPTRVAGATREEEIPSQDFYRICDDKEMIRIRVERLESGLAYAEKPPSRTTRSVGALAVLKIDGDHLTVTSSMIMLRQRGIDAHSDIIPVRRDDVLRVSGGQTKLLKRVVIMNETLMTTPNLAIFL